MDFEIGEPVRPDTDQCHAGSCFHRIQYGGGRNLQARMPSIFNDRRLISLLERDADAIKSGLDRAAIFKEKGGGPLDFEKRQAVAFA